MRGTGGGRALAIAGAARFRAAVRSPSRTSLPAARPLPRTAHARSADPLCVCCSRLRWTRGLEVGVLACVVVCGWPRLRVLLAQPRTERPPDALRSLHWQFENFGSLLLMLMTFFDALRLALGDGRTSGWLLARSLQALGWAFVVVFVYALGVRETPRDEVPAHSLPGLRRPRYVAMRAQLRERMGLLRWAFFALGPLAVYALATYSVLPILDEVQRVGADPDALAATLVMHLAHLEVFRWFILAFLAVGALHTLLCWRARDFDGRVRGAEEAAWTWEVGQVGEFAHQTLPPRIPSSRRLRIVILTIGTRGDVQPFVTLGQALQEAGHDVVLVTSTNFKSMVTSRGLGYRSAGFPGVDQPPEWLTIQNLGEMIKVTVRELEGNGRYDYVSVSTAFLEAALDPHGTLDERPAGEPRDATAQAEAARPASERVTPASADLILVTNHTLTFGWNVSKATGIPLRVAKLAPDSISRGTSATDAEYSSLGWVNFLRHWFSWLRVARASEQTKLSVLERTFVTEVLHDTPLAPLERLQDFFHQPAICGFSSALFPRPDDFPPWMLHCGFWMSNDAEEYVPPRELATFLTAHSSMRLVAVNFGSMVLAGEGGLVSRVVRAVLALNKRCLLITGWSQLPQDIPTEDPRLFVIDSVPHEWAFRYVDTVVHHGGAGTTARVLASGIPSVIIPVLPWSDQKLWGRTVEETNVGVLINEPNPSEDTIQRAVRRSLLDRDMRREANLKGAIVRVENAAEHALDGIEACLCATTLTPAEVVDLHREPRGALSGRQAMCLRHCVRCHLRRQEWNAHVQSAAVAAGGRLTVSLENKLRFFLSHEQLCVLGLDTPSGAEQDGGSPSEDGAASQCDSASPRHVLERDEQGGQDGRDQQDKEASEVHREEGETAAIEPGFDAWPEETAAALAASPARDPSVMDGDDAAFSSLSTPPLSARGRTRRSTPTPTPTSTRRRSDVELRAILTHAAEVEQGWEREIQPEAASSDAVARSSLEFALRMEAVGAAGAAGAAHGDEEEALDGCAEDDEDAESEALLYGSSAAEAVEDDVNEENSENNVEPDAEDNEEGNAVENEEPVAAEAAVMEEEEEEELVPRRRRSSSRSRSSSATKGRRRSSASEEERDVEIAPETQRDVSEDAESARSTPPEAAAPAPSSPGTAPPPLSVPLLLSSSSTTTSTSSTMSSPSAAPSSTTSPNSPASTLLEQAPSPSALTLASMTRSLATATVMSTAILTRRHSLTRDEGEEASNDETIESTDGASESAGASTETGANAELLPPAEPSARAPRAGRRGAAQLARSATTPADRSSSQTSGTAARSRKRTASTEPPQDSEAESEEVAENEVPGTRRTRLTRRSSSEDNESTTSSASSVPTASSARVRAVQRPATKRQATLRTAVTGVEDSETSDVGGEESEEVEGTTRPTRPTRPTRRRGGGVERSASEPVLPSRTSSTSASTEGLEPAVITASAEDASTTTSTSAGPTTSVTKTPSRTARPVVSPQARGFDSLTPITEASEHPETPAPSHGALRSRRAARAPAESPVPASQSVAVSAAAASAVVASTAVASTAVASTAVASTAAGTVSLRQSRRGAAREVAEESGRGLRKRSTRPDEESEGEEETEGVAKEERGGGAGEGKVKEESKARSKRAGTTKERELNGRSVRSRKRADDESEAEGGEEEEKKEEAKETSEKKEVSRARRRETSDANVRDERPRRSKTVPESPIPTVASRSSSISSEGTGETEVSARRTRATRGGAREAAAEVEATSSTRSNRAKRS